MSSPKNWKKLSTGPKLEMSWKNTKTGDRVDIKTKNDAGNYRIDIPDSKPIYRSSKDNARKVAVNWMRKHPMEGVLGDKYTKVRFLNDKPGFFGDDGEQYGPFDEGEIATLPTSNVKVLRQRNDVKVVS